MPNIFKILVLTLLVLLQLGCQVNENENDQDSIKVVLIAGPNDHCDSESSCHKYIQDMQVIRDGLLQQTDALNVEVQLLVADRPVVGSLDDVDVVVIHAAADATEFEWNALFPRVDEEEAYEDPEYREFLQYFDSQMDRGMGLVVLHYSTTVDHPESIKRYLKWIGGYYNEETSEVDGDFSSPGTTAIETVSFPTPDHPILNGVSPWSSEAEYYYKMELATGKNKPIPILNSELPIDEPKTETVAWAFERKDGGRGFGFTGCHNHENMYLDDFRKFVLNAVVWTAGADIPKLGIQSKLTKRYIK